MSTWMVAVSSRLGPQMGVRARSVLVAVFVVLVALIVGGAGLVFALQSTLEQSAEDTGRARAAEVVSRVAADGVSATSTALAGQSRTDAVTQILATDGTVVAMSRRSVTGEPLSDQRPAVGQYDSVERELDILDEGGGWKVVTTALTAPDQTGTAQTYYVQVAVPIRIQRDTVQAVAAFLLGGTPLLLGAVAVAVWVLVGRALRSVERIRTTVAEIDARALAARLDVPPTRDEIAALATTMNSMLDRLQASDHAQRAFVSDASHELRSPLATLSTTAELASRTDDEATRNRLLATMNAELTRMSGLVANLMTLSNTDSSDLTVPAVEVDLDDLVDHEARRLRVTSAHTIQVRLEPVRVWAAVTRIAQPLRNLVDNTERHALSTIRLTLTTDGDRARIWVDNDGSVIDPADRERVFERFVRLDDSRSRDAGGSGLGLAIARAGIRSQGGDLAVVDAPDGWCRFEARLPLTEAVPGSSALDPVPA